MTWYDVLGVPVHATPDQLRSAHRAQVRALHPDTRDPAVPTEDAEAALRLVNSAWEVLGDPVRRAAYDDTLEESAFDADGEAWTHAPLGPRFPWWIVVLAVLLAIFVLTAYAGVPATPR